MTEVGGGPLTGVGRAVRTAQGSVFSEAITEGHGGAAHGGQSEWHLLQAPGCERVRGQEAGHARCGQTGGVAQVLPWEVGTLSHNQHQPLQGARKGGMDVHFKRASWGPVEGEKPQYSPLPPKKQQQTG